MSQSAVTKRVLRVAESLFANASSIETRFYMAGGTALALHLNHRKSVDVDLFSAVQFNPRGLTEYIVKQKGRIGYVEHDTIHAEIEGVKVSLFYYPYALLEPLQKREKILLAGLGDIACMKAVAISQRAEKKDFFDMFELLKHFSPLQLKELFLRKYPDSRLNCYHVLRSFFYFDDAEGSPDPISINGTTWRIVKSWFRKHEAAITAALIC